MSGVRFAAGGPEIPYALLRQQERGELVVLAGAGVSIPAGLPDFLTLVRNIYAGLGEDWVDHPAESEGMANPDYAAPDRTLFALQRRLAHGREQIRQALEAELTTTSNGTDGHHDLLRLSRGATHPRLLTTNFDSLFERVWRTRMGRDIPSWAAAGMPAPGSADFSGVFHLHGRLADAMLGLAGSDLVMNSAEFGDAYLRSGWASRYLYDLLRHANLLVVGYRISDPPTRYLFEALSADRERFEFKDLYAIGEALPGAEENVGALWEGRGATPLLYDPDGGHRALYETLAGWATYADNPTAWAKNEATRILALNPARVTEDDWHRLDWILSRGDAPRIIETVNPKSRWLGPIVGRLSDIDSPPTLGPWISKRLGQAEMIDAALKHPRALDTQTSAIVLNTVRQRGKRLPQHKRRVWRMLIAQNAEGRADPWNSWFTLLSFARAGDSDIDVRRMVCREVVPRPVLEPLRRWPGSSVPPAGTVRSLAEIEITARAEQAVDVAQLLGAWPHANDLPLLRDLTTALTASLAEARELLGRDKSTLWEVASIEAHPQDRHRRSGFYPVTRLTADLWERVAASDRSAARVVSECWRDGGFELLRRLWLHSLTNAPLFTGVEVGTALLGLDDQTFWGAGCQREIMKLMASRWNDIPPTERAALEARIIAGEA